MPHPLPHCGNRQRDTTPVRWRASTNAWLHAARRAHWRQRLRPPRGGRARAPYAAPPFSVRPLFLLFRDAYSGLPAATWLLSAAAFINRSGSMVVPYLSLYLKDSYGLSAETAGLF